MPTYNILGNPPRHLLERVLVSPSLVFCAVLNEASGSVIDWGTNRFTGTVNGNPTYSKAIAVNYYGLDFDGTGDYVDFGNQAALDFERTDSFSGLAIVVPNISAVGAILSKRGTTGWEWNLNATVNPLVRLRNTATTNELQETANAALTNGTAYMLGFSYDGSSGSAGLILYKNGASDATTVNANTLTASIINSTAVQIGAQDAASAFNGDICCVALWNRVLSAATMRQLAFLGGFL